MVAVTGVLFPNCEASRCPPQIRSMKMGSKVNGERPELTAEKRCEIVDCEFAIAKQTGVWVEHEGVAIRQILDAGDLVDGAHFYWIDRYLVG